MQPYLVVTVRLLWVTTFWAWQQRSLRVQVRDASAFLDLEHGNASCPTTHTRTILAQGTPLPSVLYPLILQYTGPMYTRLQQFGRRVLDEAVPGDRDVPRLNEDQIDSLLQRRDIQHVLQPFAKARSAHIAMQTVLGVIMVAMLLNSGLHDNYQRNHGQTVLVISQWVIQTFNTCLYGQVLCGCLLLFPSHIQRLPRVLLAVIVPVPWAILLISWLLVSACVMAYIWVAAIPIIHLSIGLHVLLFAVKKLSRDTLIHRACFHAAAEAGVVYIVNAFAAFACLGIRWTLMDQSYMTALQSELSARVHARLQLRGYDVVSVLNCL